MEGAVTNLDTKTFKENIEQGVFDVIVDTRTFGEWESGHVPNATFIDSLQLFGTPQQVSTPDELAGCRSRACSIAVYCRSGARAGGAAVVLEGAGFEGEIYNGQGVQQWTEAGFDLVDTPSVIPPCTKNDDEEVTPVVANESVCVKTESSVAAKTESSRFALHVMILGTLFSLLL